MPSNAVNQKVQKAAERINTRRAREQAADLRLALAHDPTRRLLWRLLYEARVSVAHITEDHPEMTASVWHPSAQIHYNAGRQDFGNLLMGWLRQADPHALPAMVLEAVEREQADARELEAAQTPSSTTKEQDDDDEQ